MKLTKLQQKTFDELKKYIKDEHVDTVNMAVMLEMQFSEYVDNPQKDTTMLQFIANMSGYLRARSSLAKDVMENIKTMKEYMGS